MGLLQQLRIKGDHQQLNFSIIQFSNMMHPGGATMTSTMAYVSIRH